MRYIIIMLTALTLLACGNPSNSAELNDRQVDAVVVNEDTNEANEAAEETTTEVDKETLAQEIKESVENEDPTVITDEFKQLEEFDVVNDTIDLSNASLDIVEDNYGKRVLLITNDQGIETHKTIYIKNKNRLKIIEFNQGQIFNDII